MTAKEFLRGAWALKKDIERKQNQIIELQALAERTTGSYEALRVSGTPNHSKLEDAVMKLSPIKDMLAKDIAQFAEKYQEISAVIDAVENPTFRQLLAMRYLSFMKWEEIAVKMNYTYRHVTREHGRALNKVVVPDNSDFKSR